MTEATTSTKKCKKTRRKQVLLAFFAVFSVLILAWLLFHAVILIGNQSNGYYTFGKYAAAVSTDALMSGEGYANSIDADTFVYFDTSVNKDRGITEGQIILVKKTVDGVLRVAPRRVYRKKIVQIAGGKTATTYLVSADASGEVLPFEISPDEVVGVYEGQNKTLGSYFLFVNTFTGFVVALLLPTVIAIAFSIFLVFSYLHKRN